LIEQMEIKRFTVRGLSLCIPQLGGAAVLFFSGLAIFVGPDLRGEVVESPDARIRVEVDLDGGQPTYEVRYGGEEFLESSPLGLVTSIGSFTEGLSLEGTEERKIDETYELPHGKVSEVHYVANELTLHFKNEPGDFLDLVFRVSDRDVAFRYYIRSNKGEEQRVTIESEHSGFDFPEEATAFVSQQVAWGGGFAKSKPSYEEGYMMDVPVGTKPGPNLGFTFPALFKIGDRGWLMVSETGVTGNHAGCRLGNPDEDGTYPIAFPEAAENAGIGEADIRGALPFQSAWRTITLGETLAPIVESTVATDVVEPLYEMGEGMKPGRATWSWLLWQDGSMNETDQRAFIDLADELDFEYILIDAWWDERVGREKIVELVDYAASKDVSVFLWYNSNGYWNDAFQSPRDFMHSAPVRQKEMAWLQSIGVKGLKVDFFGGDKQVTMKLYEDILTDANNYGLVMNFHGATLPRGWERMYPNHMTSEAVTASENLVFSQGFADKEAFHSTVYPFVRNPVAAMDYGPVVLNKRFSRNPDRGTERRTTDTFQLATAVTFFSPLQHYGLTPNSLEEQPEHVLNFLREVPAAWDETRFLDGYPGKLFAVARRSGESWYIGVTNGEDQAKELQLKLPGFEGKTFTLLSDRKDSGAGVEEVTVGNDGVVNLSLASQGGAVLYQ
jgi:hypothetical protein